MAVGDTIRFYNIGEIEAVKPPPPKRPEYFVGLDLGKSMDYTAVAILEVYGEAPEAVYHCRHLRRFKLGTSYPTIVNEIRGLCTREPLLSNMPRLCVDQTGVGAPVVDLFKQANLSVRLEPVLIHGGDHAVHENGSWRVPKRELVGATQVALQTGRLKIAKDLPEVDALIRELQTFEVEISQSGFDSYNARTGAHDDLVLALAMPLWFASRRARRVLYA
jgi:hypothetical protein